MNYREKWVVLLIQGPKYFNGKKNLPSVDAGFTLLEALLLQGQRETSVTMCFKGASHCSAKPYPKRKKTACCLVRWLPFSSSSKSMNTPRVGTVGEAPCMKYSLLIMFHSKKTFPT